MDRNKKVDVPIDSLSAYDNDDADIQYGADHEERLKFKHREGSLRHECKEDQCSDFLKKEE